MKNKQTQKVKMLVSMAGIDWSCKPGDIIELKTNFATNLILSGQAEPVKATKKVERTEAKPVVEKPEVAPVVEQSKSEPVAETPEVKKDEK